MNLVLSILFASVLIGLFARKMTPMVWGLLVFIILLAIARTYLGRG